MQEFKKKICEFRECIWYCMPKITGTDKGKSRWASGIWLGVREESNEVIIGTENGVIKVRTVRRKPTHEERRNMVHIDAMRGTPWEPVPGRDSDVILSRIVPRPESPEAHILKYLLVLIGLEE